jgi:Periplasmic copper-binding protein (NosD)
VKPGHGKIIGRIKRLDLAARHGLVDRALERPARRDYQPVTINKSISLTGVPGAGIDTQGETGISGGGFNGTINLANLIIRNVSGSGTSGIGSGGLSSLNVVHCTVQGYSVGIFVASEKFVIADTVVTNNQTGIDVGLAAGTLDHVTLSNNATGVVLETPSPHAPPASVTAVNTIAESNGTGFAVSGFSNLSLARSTVIGNVVGIRGSATSFGDNHIKGNRTDVQGGTLTNVGRQ